MSVPLALQTGKHSFNKELIHHGRPENRGRKRRLLHSGHVIGSICFYRLEGAKQACLLLEQGPLDTAASWGPSEAIPPSLCSRMNRVHQTLQTRSTKCSRRNLIGGSVMYIHYQGSETRKSRELNQETRGLTTVTVSPRISLRTC